MLTSTLSFAVLASVALAAPTANKRQEIASSSQSSFTVPRVLNENYVRNGTRALAKAYAKFGWSMSSSSAGSSGDDDSDSDAWLFPDSSEGSSDFGSDSVTSTFSTSYATATTISAVPSSTTATSKDDARSGYSTSTSTASAATATASGSVTGEVTATPEAGDCEYLCPVVIGGQTFNLDFDTGSSDLWVYSASAAGSHVSLDTSSSSFTVKDGYTFELLYGDGSSSSGIVGTDTVVVGGATVTTQAVEVATEVSAAFTSDISDGLLGLAFDSLNSVSPKQQSTFFSNIMSQLELPVFTVYLNESSTQEGEYEFGAIDSSKYTGDINYTPVITTNGFWQFTSTSYQVDGINGTNADASPTLADTGTSLILMDDIVLEAYYAQVNNVVVSDGSYIFPCTETLPSFGIAIGDTGYYATVPGDVMNYGSAGGEYCYGGLQSNSGEGYQVIGDVLLRQHFVIFDGGATTIGFADKA